MDFKTIFQVVLNISYYIFLGMGTTVGLLHALENLSSKEHTCDAADVPLGSIHKKPLYAYQITTFVAIVVGVVLLTKIQSTETTKLSPETYSVLKFVFLVACPFLHLLFWTQLVTIISFLRLKDDEVKNLKCDGYILFWIKDTRDRMVYQFIIITWHALINAWIEFFVLEPKNHEQTKPENKECLLPKEHVEQKAQ
jgi:hypothetical protein